MRVWLRWWWVPVWLLLVGWVAVAHPAGLLAVIGLSACAMVVLAVFEDPR